MKDFIKKKLYLILMFISFSTLFSAILYADPIYCENDSECPEGMICVIPGNFCMEAAAIVCDITWEGKTEALCWIQRVTIPGGVPCKWTGMQTVCNTFIGW